MTDVLVAKRVEDPLSDVEAIIDKGYFQIRPSRPYAANGQWVDDAWSQPINMTGSALTFKLDPLADIPYELFWHYTDGRNQVKEGSELRYVTASGTPLKWEDLQQTAGVGTQPAVPSDVEAQVATLAAQVATLTQALSNVSGGASNIGGISGISDDGKALISGTNTYSQMRGLLGAGTSNLAIGTAGTDAAPGTLTATVTGLSTTVTGHTTSIGTITTALGNKADLNGSGLVDASDIDPAIARLTDVTAVQSTWTNISGRPNVYVPLPCPNSATGVFPSRPSVPPGTVVVWISSAIPPFGGVYMQVGDEWEDRPDV